MAVDPRQILAGFLTLTMFFMLGNMIKRDQFDSIEVERTRATVVAERKVENRIEAISGPWKTNDPKLRRCWSKLEPRKAKGFITLTLVNGPDYHLSQIADAVAVARYLGAVLVIPDIQGSSPGEKRKFRDIYDVEKFVKNLEDVVKIADPADISADKPTIVRVPTRPRQDYIAERIEPIFRSTRNVRLVSYFPSLNMKIRGLQKNELESSFCSGMFGTLELQPEIRGVADKMLERLRTLSQESDGHFIAIDMRVDILQLKGCQGTSERKKCFSALEVGKLLQKVGFTSETVIYLTQPRWHEGLDPLKAIFPRSYTKEYVIPSERKDVFLDEGSSQLEAAIDFYVCTQSDVFVPAIPGLFYANVVGQRIAAGKTHILVPTRNPTPSDSVSHYVSDKSHLAYSCLC